jgi:hypothetical protein
VTTMHYAAFTDNNECRHASAGSQSSNRMQVLPPKKIVQDDDDDYAGEKMQLFCFSFL